MARALPYHDRSLRPARTATDRERQKWRALALGTVQCGENVTWTGRRKTYVGVVVYRGRRKWHPKNLRPDDWLSAEARRECLEAPPGRHKHKRWGPVIVRTIEGTYHCPPESRIHRLDPLHVRAALIRFHPWKRPSFTKPPPLVPQSRSSTPPARPFDREDDPPDLYDLRALRELSRLFDRLDE